MRYLFIYLFIYLSSEISSQNNLVPNYSFEYDSACPVSVNQLNNAVPWFHAYKSVVSSDLFNTCDPYPNHDVWIPFNLNGYQFARTGNGYAGIILICPNNNCGFPWREYAEVRLGDTLVSGKIYCVNFYVSFSNKCKTVTSSIGVKFSPDSLNINYPSSLLLNYTPDVANPPGNFLTDTSNWMNVSGTYTANGAENFITIGNFFDDANTNYYVIDSNAAQYFAYYYLDDVSVVEISNANAGSDTVVCKEYPFKIGGTPTFDANYVWSQLSGNATIDSVNIAQPHITFTSKDTSVFVMQKTQCSVITYDTVQVIFKSCAGIEENYFGNYFSVFPNPAIDEIIISSKQNEPFVVSIRDIAGREVKNIASLLNEKTIIQTNDLVEGIYSLSVRSSSSKKIFTRKIIVKHS